MSNAARVDDPTEGNCDIKANCCPHDGREGIVREGSPNVYINGKPAHRRGDRGEILVCAHKPPVLYFTTREGSGSVFINGKAAARIHDETSCNACGTRGEITEGSGNVFIGG